MFKSGMCAPKPRDTEAGRDGEGDDKRLLPKNTPIDMEKPLPAEAALLIPQAVATQEETKKCRADSDGGYPWRRQDSGRWPGRQGIG